ncbi:hypothetical protein Adt_11001 [Abeliophyllum distichum]|uniref:Uncharacterized protein n=1 Tax=Abeliophyllum distichum TaxID=126358 RepID=A0ABD1ULQ7_9LAMI
MPLKQMLGFKAFAPLPPISRPLSPILPFHNLNFRPKKPKPRKQFSVHSQNNNGQSSEHDSSSNNVGGVNGRSRLNLRWADLLLDPNPDNIVAVGLTGILTWAGVQVLWQLLVIGIVILVTALKYTVVAALLVVILITLL